MACKEGTSGLAPPEEQVAASDGDRRIGSGDSAECKPGGSITDSDHLRASRLASAVADRVACDSSGQREGRDDRFGELHRDDNCVVDSLAWWSLSVVAVLFEELFYRWWC